MKKFLLYFSFISLFYFVSFSQMKVQNLTVFPDGKIYKSDSTIKGHLYEITVEGTYSMWPQFKDCHGVDAAYVYDAPQEEIDNFRWPPQKIKIGGIEIDVFPLPHWVGDPKVYEIPPSQISTPIFKMSMRAYKGFRIDNEPLPNSGFQPLTHRYTIKKYGDGNPFTFQILDSNRSIIEEKTIPRYEDNCGELRVKIVDLDAIVNDTTGNTGGSGNDFDTKRGRIEIGSVERWFKNGKDIGAVIEVSILVDDSTSKDGKINILKNLNPSQIGIISDGRVICDIDSIVCKERQKPFSLLLLIDNTESMQGPISEQDKTRRMDASKNAITKFVESLLPSDEVMIMTFNEHVKVKQTWTTDKILLKKSISEIESEDKLTAVFGAINVALDSLALRDKPNKALIVLSDGGNTYPPSFEESNVLEQAKNKGITTFVIALGFTQLEIDKIGKEKLTEIVSLTPNGRLFSVYASQELIDVYQKISKEILSDEDCYIYIKNDSCKPGEERWIRILYTPNDSTIITKVVKYKCPDIKSVKEIIFNEELKQTIKSFSVVPNPSTNKFKIDYELFEPENVKISIYDYRANLIQQFDQGYSIQGNFDVNLKLPKGMYIVVLSTTKYNVIQKLIVE